ncbi:MAG TPA: hypothetical protein VH306_05935 [Gaiellaceae bacterium]
MRARTLLLLLLAAVVVVPGCGSGGGGETGALPVLSGSTLPTLAADTHPVDAAGLSSDADPKADLEGRLGDWGFSHGTERVFQGESERLDRVVSRTLEFDSAEGASSYVDYLGGHPDLFYGVGSTAKRFALGGRAGYLVDAASCACHRAAPTLVAVLARGNRVTYLEANGGAVTDASVRRLVAQAP